RVTWPTLDATAPSLRPCGVDSVLGANKAGDAEDPGRLSIAFAGTRIPALSGRIRVRVKGRYDHRTGNHGRCAEIQYSPTACWRTHHREGACRGIHGDPSAFLVSADGIIRHGIDPGRFESLLHPRIVQQFQSRWRLHP